MGLRRLITSIVLCSLLGTPAATAQSDADALAAALARYNVGDLAGGSNAARDLTDPVALDILAWTRLRRGEGSFEEYISFLDRNPDWPGLAYLRRQGEPSIPEGGDAASILDYFADVLPQTGAGSLALARALADTGNPVVAEAIVVRAWTSLVMTGTDAQALNRAFGNLLTQDHHIARLDHLLWENAEDRARAMFSLVPEDYVPLAEARLALRDRRPGVNGLIDAIPASLQDDPGLAYERFIWRVREGLWDTAGALMVERSTSPDTLGRPAEWGRRRADLARDVMREGDHDTCYDYASNHQIDPEDDYIRFADLEWVAGYCALQLNRADIAANHFQRFSEVVFSPISVGRAGYWLGRAHEAAGNAAAAADGYALGAQYQSSFYGQLAQERGGLPVDPEFTGTRDYGDWRNSSFADLDVFRAAILLYEAGEVNLAERFFTHITERLDETEAGMMGALMLELEEPHYALMVAKRAAQSGHEIYPAYYPLADLEDVDLPVPRAFALSIARRESEFDPVVVSGAGAIGLMQVMPGTGRDSAGELGLDFSEARLRNDPAYNVLLGSNYIAGLLEDYDGNPVLVTIGYNAGPGRVRQWRERFGDPRQADDVIDWIEDVPFSETRNYIMRVIESLPIYEAQLTGELPTLGLSERLVQ
ncbi:lytic transglycosylase domain-containing protein [Jannaschia sp. CCS1]|uniref:lytic transglycosylase domain-containing protein n=1 Tax=Jannaschia sp. (strain CCS1) TaxID=290400 RepID=UPI000053A00F|nr:lytic transglycosylase domain-containing protein [Jannaschia sp. CCS1]ABD52951.1 Lytic transglycosylase catalytic [Jannaschia sp. CCS1]